MKQTQHTPSTKDGDVNIKGKYAAGRDINISKLANFKWLILSIFTITLITLAWFSRAEITSYLNSFEKFEAGDSENLRILLLPFHPDVDLDGVYLDHRRDLFERLSVKDTTEIPVDLKLTDGVESPRTNEEARAIGVKKNADLVIWGSFIENKEKVGKVRLRYLLLNDFDLPSNNLMSGDQEGITNNKLSTLRNGFLQNDLDYIINWIKGMTAYNEGDFKVAFQYFEEIQKDSTALYEFDTKALTNLSLIYSVFKRYQYALPILEIIQQRLDKDPEKFLDIDIAANLSALAMTYEHIGNIEKSEEYHLKAVDLVNSSDENGKEFQEYKSSINSNLGVLYSRYNMYEESEKFLLISTNSDSILLNDYKLDYENLRNIAGTKINLANLKSRIAKNKEALNILLKVEKDFKGFLTKEDRLWLGFYNNMGQVLYHLGDYKGALISNKKELKLASTIYDDFHPSLMNPYVNIAASYEKLNNLDSALINEKIALDIAEHNKNSIKESNLAVLYCNHGMSLAAANKFEESIEIIQKSIDIYTSGISLEENTGLGFSYHALAKTYRLMEQYTKAIEFQKKGNTILETNTSIGRDHLYTGIFYQNMAKIYRDKGDFREALDWIEKAIRIYTVKIERTNDYFVEAIEMKENILAEIMENTETTVSK